MCLLRAEHLTVCYRKKEIVRDVSFRLDAGETLGIMGESGSGKTTLLRAVMGLPGGAAVTGGSLKYRGRDLAGLPEKELRKLWGTQIGMVFQNSEASFCPQRTVGAQIYEAMRAHGRISRREAWERAAALMEKVGLEDPERVWRSYPSRLSGGMNQRVGILAAMLLEPPLLLADEPTSALDADARQRVAEELLLMRREYGTAMLLVTHDAALARRLCGRVLILAGGRTAACGPTGEVLRDEQGDGAEGGAYKQGLPERKQAL